MESLPLAFREQIQNQLAGAYPAFIEALQKLSPTSIRLNPKKNLQAQHDNQVPWTPWGNYLPERPVFTLDPTFHAGRYYVQEASSMFLEQAFKKAVDPSQTIKVLDLCAAPGGKSTHLLSLMNEKSFLISNEVIRSRASVLSENIQKWGYPNCLVTSNDPADFTSLSGFFDLIVIDAPCSGEGMFRKDPLAVNQWSPENVASCAVRQQRILHDVWPALKENGVVIYCTCTYNEKENEDNLIAFRKDHEVEFIDLAPDAAWNIETITKGGLFGYRFFPHKINGEGFFLAAMRKSESSETVRGKNKSRLTSPTKKVAETLKTWVNNADAFSLYQHNDLVFLLPAAWTNEIETLLQHLRFVYGGTNLATVKHDKLIPEHSLAVSIVLNRDNFKTVAVDEKQALQYLRRETISLNESTKGFALLLYENIPIGWVNILQNRVNNLYPQEWRIRMAPL